MALKRHREWWRRGDVTGRRASGIREAGAQYDAPPASTRARWWDAVTAHVQRGALDAMEEHARRGIPIVVWRDGKVVEIGGQALDREIARVRRELGLVSE